LQNIVTAQIKNESKTTYSRAGSRNYPASGSGKLKEGPGDQLDKVIYDLVDQLFVGVGDINGRINSHLTDFFH